MADKKKVLVTGISGRIGTVLRKHLGGTYELPKDDVAIAAVITEIEDTLIEANTPGFSGRITAAELCRGHLKNPEAERLRGQFMRLSMFQASAIPAIKAGGYGRFELYDLEKDPGQHTDLSTQLPDVAERLKTKLLNINASVPTGNEESRAGTVGPCSILTKKEVNDGLLK